jgi:multidrug efflux pump subunit AcrB
MSDVAMTTRALISGEVMSRFRDGDEYYNIRLMIPEAQMSSKQAVANIPINSAQGGYLRVGDIATVVSAVGPVEIVREDQVKQVIVRGDANNVSVGSALQALQATLARASIPAGYELQFGGQAQMMDEMRSNLLTVLAFALFFAFVILVVQFNNLGIPLYIIAGVPISLSGLVILLYLSGIPIGATVIIGVLVVVAANVMEGVLLLNYAEDIQREENISREKAVIKAARIRFRPRMMTSLGVLVGFLPLALNLEQGGDMLQPMAVAAVGGMTFTVLVTLFFVPVLYTSARRKSPEIEAG